MTLGDTDLMRTEVVTAPTRRGRSIGALLKPRRMARLRHVANAYYASIDAVVGPHVSEEDTSLADEVFACALSLVTTCWRMAEMAEATGARWPDVEPLLLLADELLVRNRGLLHRMRDEIEPVHRRWLEDSQQLVGDMLQPMIDGVGDRARDRLRELVAQGAAPSPFCKVWPDWYERIERGSEPAVDGDHLAV